MFCRSCFLLHGETEALAVVRTTGRPGTHMTLDVLSFLQPNAPANPASPPDPGSLGEAETPEEGQGAGFASVLAQVAQPVAPELPGQGLAADPHAQLDADESKASNPNPSQTAETPAPAWMPLVTAPPAPMVTPAATTETLFDNAVVRPKSDVLVAGAASDALALKSTLLPQGRMQLITPAVPSADTDADSLMSFAQGQGLDDAAMQRLFGDEFKSKATAVAQAAMLPTATWIAGGLRHPGLPSRILEIKSNEASLHFHGMGNGDRLELELDLRAALSELAPDADLKALKAEERAALALRIGEMLAQRMVAQAQRGQWQLRFALNPQNLGRVEIDMQMRGGELEATLGALNPSTRELLQEALPRLREMLQQSGMDVASLNIGSGGASQHGGQPTPRGQANGLAEGENTPADAPKQHVRVQGPDGWDIWV